MGSGLRLDIAWGTGFVVETGFFCIYTCLFVAALPVLTSARRLKDARSANSAWIFLIVTILMYMVATIYLIFSGFSFYKSTFIDTEAAISYLNDPRKWEFLGLIIIICIQTWLGDALVIYRCYFVWDNNLWLIVVPVGLLLCSIGINTFALYWYRHPFAIALVPGSRLLRSIYPLAFAQNFLTTGLIILKIFLQHRASKKAGVRNVGSKLSLLRITRIIVESAALYTIQLLLLNILCTVGNNFEYVVQPAIIPSIGITFVLLALRIEASRHETEATKNDLGIRSSIIPQWLRQPDHEIGSEDSQNDSSPAEDDPELIEQKLDN